VTARAWTVPGWAALGVVAALAVAWPDAAEAVRWIPFLLGLVLFSLPHGAVDHHVPRRLGRRGGPAFLAAYLAGVAAVLGLWAAAPVATLVGFFVVAAVHWGSGDGWYARTVHRRPPFATRLEAALFVGARGALPVALPALAHPAELARGADAVLRAVGAGPAPLLAGSVRAAGLAAIGLLVAGAAAAAAHNLRRHPGAALLDIGELLALAAFFVVTPAVLAVGTYLLAWHAPRHVARLIAADPVQAALPPRRALAAWGREAAPLTALSLAGLGLLAAAAWRVPAAGEAVGGAALALIAALTLPHAAVVAWMDREQGVWRSASGAPRPWRPAAATPRPAR